MLSPALHNNLKEILRNQKPHPTDDIFLVLLAISSSLTLSVIKLRAKYPSLLLCTIKWTAYFSANLAATHTVFVIKHNQIADELHRINPQWNDERIFQV